MAKEWYLMNTSFDTVSGFENESFDGFATDAFGESLNSPIGSDVEVCNYDLTKRVKARVIIQGNTPDTKLKSMQRMVLATIGTFKSGEYIYYKNRYWLVVGLVDDNGIYEKAVLVLCNYLLTWENQSGKVIQRWASISSASQYNHGETSNKFYYVRSDQLMILTPDDDECLLIRHKQRFIIDRRCEIYERNFDSSVLSDTSKDVITYELTRMDNVLYDYQDSGHSEFMAYQDEQHENDGYYVVDGKGYWLCDVPSSSNKREFLSSSIECDEPVIYIGLEPTIFYGKFCSSSGDLVSAFPHWSINCDFRSSLHIEQTEGAIAISVDDEKLMGKSFELSLYSDGYEKTTILVSIEAFI